LLLAAVVLARAQLHYEQAAYSDNDAVAVAADQSQMQMPPQEQEQMQAQDFEQEQTQDMDSEEDQDQDQDQDQDMEEGQDQESEAETETEGSFAEVSAEESEERKKKHPKQSLSRAAHKVGNAITALKDAVRGRRNVGSNSPRSSSGRLTPLRRKQQQKKRALNRKPRPFPRKSKGKSFSGVKRDGKRRRGGKPSPRGRGRRGGRRGGRGGKGRNGGKSGSNSFDAAIGSGNGDRSSGSGRGGRGGSGGSGSRGGDDNSNGGRISRGGRSPGGRPSVRPRPSAFAGGLRPPSKRPSFSRTPARTPDDQLWHSERWVAKDDPNRDPEMAKLNLALEAVKEDILSTNKQINDERRWVIAVSKIISSYNTKMQRVEAHIIALRKEMKQLYKKKKQIENLKLQKALEAKLKEARDELKTLTTSLKHVAAKQGELNKSGKDLRQTIAGIQAQLAKLRGQQLLKKKCKRGFKLSKKLKKCVPSCKKGKRYSTQLKKCIPKCKKSHRYSKKAKKCVPRKGKKAKKGKKF